MTPAARAQSAIEILDRVLAGEPTEKALTQWARSNRFAGSKDRAAIRDLVFDAIRCKRSHAHYGGTLTGRGLIIGGLRERGQDPANLFDGSTYGPKALTPDEQGLEISEIEGATAVDLPGWVWHQFQQDLGRNAAPTANALRNRAHVFLRVNTRKSTVRDVQQALEKEGILTEPSPISNTALQVTQNPRRVATSRAYQNGLVELQDAASQAVCDLQDLTSAHTVLDFCAGGGGKTLALAARSDAKFTAHDANFSRMKDIPSRAERAGVRVELAKSISQSQKFDLVFCDVPCSGSGSWRRSPDGKWALTQEKLSNLQKTQQEILSTCAKLVADNGALAYATCSVFKSENHDQIEHFMQANPEWKLSQEQQFLPQDGGDGFYIATLTRA